MFFGLCVLPSPIAGPMQASRLASAINKCNLYNEQLRIIGAGVVVIIFLGQIRVWGMENEDLLLYGASIVVLEIPADGRI